MPRLGVCAQYLALFTLIPVFASQSALGQNSPDQAAQNQIPQDQTQQDQSQQDQSQQVQASPGVDSPAESSIKTSGKVKLPDFNPDIYYKNKLEFSLETGWLPNNIPFVFDFIVNSPYTIWPLHYTLVPNIASLRWELDNLEGPGPLRGDVDLSFSGSYTAIPRGAETRYFAFDFGIRRNFVPRRWRIAPYVEGRGGVGNINAKGPDHVLYAQGQDLTFTLMTGSGARYNFNPRYSISAGMTYMHVSNFYLSEPKYQDFGINVYGSIVGVYMRLGKPKHTSMN